jgi:hypothetical protein
MNATPTVTKAADPAVAYKVAANIFMGECKRLFGEELKPADAKGIYRRMFGSDEMTTENLNVAVARMGEYEDGDTFANDLLTDEEEG